ncbi:fimbrial protein [Burkholderia ubonensis]|uniref:Fimbrial protein n=1 Tax=Burkholderia ubonensis TaxID=101571 RepID=A0A108C845_9BURK|nr:fimbrial protein [Burkholderia ubonensis]KWK69918.1 fimbrial protein [Burkholderia ubonensis]
MQIKKAAAALPLLLIAAGATISTTAHASDGTISFDGRVIASTCKVDGESNGNFTVSLPPVSTTALAAVGNVAGRTPFSLLLSGCTVGEGNPVKVGIMFEPGANVDQSTGRLTLDKGADKAQGIQLNVLDAQQQRIQIGSSTTGDIPQSVNIGSDGKAKLDYFTEYYASGAVTAGDVNSRVEYSLVYQ